MNMLTIMEALMAALVTFGFPSPSEFDTRVETAPAVGYYLDKPNQSLSIQGPELSPSRKPCGH